MRKIKYLVLFASLFIFSGAYASDKSSGCGLGWMILKKNSLVSSSLRATTNAMFLNTVGMTLGTSGCARHSIVQNDVKGIHFAEANFHQLMAQVAIGKGEYVSALADVMGCSASKAEFASLLQKKYENVFAENSNAISFYQNVKREVLLDEKLSKGCTLI